MAVEHHNLSPEAQSKIRTSETELTAKYHFPFRHHIIGNLLRMNSLIYNVLLLNLGIESEKAQNSEGAQACFGAMVISAAWHYFKVDKPFTQRWRAVMAARDKHRRLIKELTGTAKPKAES